MFATEVLINLEGLGGDLIDVVDEFGEGSGIQSIHLGIIMMRGG